MSLDAFQAKYTSEDNSSFTQILDDENRRRKEQYGWAWDAQRRVEAQRDRMLEGRERLLIEAPSGAGVKERFRIEAPQPAGLIEAAPSEFTVACEDDGGGGGGPSGRDARRPAGAGEGEGAFRSGEGRL